MTPPEPDEASPVLPDSEIEISIFELEDAGEVVDPIPENGSDSPEDGEEEAEALAETASAPETKKPIPFWIELPILIGVALIVAVIIKTFFFQAFYIPSGSMKETLQVEDRVLVNKISYAFSDIAIGDVVVFDDPRSGFEAPPEDAITSAMRNLFESIGLATPQSEFIKRVVGLPGDEVELVENQLFVNGIAIDEPYLADDAKPPSNCGDSDYGPTVVPEDHLLVMGDNRCHSSDGRSFGPIPREDVVGKAFVLIWPPSHWSGL